MVLDLLLIGSHLKRSTILSLVISLQERGCSWSCGLEHWSRLLLLWVWCLVVLLPKHWHSRSKICLLTLCLTNDWLERRGGCEGICRRWPKHGAWSLSRCLTLLALEKARHLLLRFKSRCKRPWSLLLSLLLLWNKHISSSTASKRTLVGCRLGLEHRSRSCLWLWKDWTRLLNLLSASEGKLLWLWDCWLILDSCIGATKLKLRLPLLPLWVRVICLPHRKEIDRLGVSHGWLWVPDGVWSYWSACIVYS